jgi:hypothetical protein
VLGVGRDGAVGRCPQAGEVGCVAAGAGRRIDEVLDLLEKVGEGSGRRWWSPKAGQLGMDAQFLVLEGSLGIGIIGRVARGHEGAKAGAQLLLTEGWADDRVVWVDEPIPGDRYVDPRYRNPMTVYPSYRQFLGVAFGPITISGELFANLSARRYEPSDADLQRFVGSEAHKNGFRFLTKGLFYRAIGGDLEARLSYFQAV